ncbi:type II toxin-antitoxin system prevent-host-death family antitoxin [Rhizobium sp. CC-YZS058]|uniref:type II toxin-antitoxin system Phd/YefM family antitoxin n=1 Tax=Rhizobium sp. CC-YZS058 TaxID=3042153 RepID=UPI002B054693|nr:type II toxin-antitoxin system prevent-host-death family antitoxin [Rhizobium sp. CC-YZS058]MEA3533551.1 type II toxin-antitoxin system prevent-host-death family antitoxin [Rhizobium sp. CC-YZS058]
MRISITEAADRLPELVRRVEAGEDVVLTDNGVEAARLRPVEPAIVQAARSIHDPEERLRFLDELLARVRQKTGGTNASFPDAAHSQDFLYDDETGLPA